MITREMKAFNRVCTEFVHHSIPEFCLAGYQDGWDDNQMNNWGGDGGW